jgi:hypothetical protein
LEIFKEKYRDLGDMTQKCSRTNMRRGGVLDDKRSRAGRGRMRRGGARLDEKGRGEAGDGF